MPSRMTQESYRPRVSDRTMVDNSATPLLTSFREPNGAVMKANMKRLGWETSIAASSLRGLQGRTATNQNDQAAEEKKTNGCGGLDAAKAVLASSSGEKYFSLDIPLYRTSE